MFTVWGHVGVKVIKGKSITTARITVFIKPDNASRHADELIRHFIVTLKIIATFLIH
jgi:hypothetical protein